MGKNTNSVKNPLKWQPVDKSKIKQPTALPAREPTNEKFVQCEFKVVFGNPRRPEKKMNNFSEFDNFGRGMGGGAIMGDEYYQQ